MALVMPHGQPQAMQQGTSSAYDQIQNAYQAYLGRTGSAEEINSHLGGGKLTAASNVNYALGNIANSPEAQAYRNRPQESAPPPSDPGPEKERTSDAPPPQGGQTTPPGVPQTYASPNIMGMMTGAMGGAPQVQSQFAGQQIRDFTGRAVSAPTYAAENVAQYVDSRPQGQTYNSQLQLSPITQFQSSALTQPTYAQSLFSQFTDPRNAQTQQGKTDLINTLLQNPDSLGQVWQDQMFEAQKDDALAFSKQFGLQNAQSLVGRGIFGGDGQTRAMQQDLQSALGSDLLKGRRDIASQAALQNRADRLNVLGAAEGALSGDTTRGSQVYQNTLAGQSAQAGENQFAAQFLRQLGIDRDEANRQNYASQLSGQAADAAQRIAEEEARSRAFGLTQASQQANRQMSLQELLAQMNSNQFAAQFGLQGQLAEAGNERDNYAAYLSGRNLQGQENARAEQFRQSAFGLSESARQNAAQNALQAFMAGNNADLGWANYGLNADQQFLNYLAQGF